MPFRKKLREQRCYACRRISRSPGLSVPEDKASTDVRSSVMDTITIIVAGCPDVLILSN